MTTNGYGDVVPVTLIGRICAAAIGIVSVGMVALPAGILASGFNEALHKRRKQYEDVVYTALQDGVIDTNGHEQLRIVQEELGLSAHEAANMLKAGYRKISAGTEVCGQCGKTVLLPKDPDDSGGSSHRFPSSVRQLRTILFLACQGLLNYAVWQSQDHLL